MNKRKIQSLLRQLPSIDSLLQRTDIKQLVKKYGRKLILLISREVLEQWRNEIKSGIITMELLDKALSDIAEEINTRAQEWLASPLVPVINATGVIIHTNLGRALLSQSAAARLASLSRSYLNLEFQLETGKRGARDEPIEKLVSQLYPERSCLVVNNNAAAVLLILDTLACGKEVIVSRGELVEIGGSFRIPEVMKKSGALLREVGTTNKTHLYDYEGAINKNTALLLQVHPSNFRVMGFTEAVSTEELVKLAKRHNLPLVQDMGTGNMIDMKGYGIYDEPHVAQILNAGVNLVSFSGDKLLGGPQCGIIIGDKTLVMKLKKNPLLRALRVGKLTYLALEATLRSYITESAEKDLPVLHMLSLSKREIAYRAGRLVDNLTTELKNTVDIQLIDGSSKVGGGTVPLEELPTKLIAIKSQKLSSEDILIRLRENNIPIIGRIQQDCVVLDLRTVLKYEEEDLKAALKKIFAK
jgi:L-seryl-tRNA(Ser) seleniumtransferase